MVSFTDFIQALKKIFHTQIEEIFSGRVAKWLH